ncbi:MAG: hypothetical protein FJZ96_14960 [Chloroflexi bacterium]|nr:hypothetical protein [Chloroflexota bacterium]
MQRPPIESPTLRRHRKQQFWQILFPLVLFTILILSGGGLVIAAGRGDARLWADISLIWLILPLLFLSLLLLALLGGLIYLLVCLKNATPRLAGRLQNFFVQVTAGTRRAADAAVKPILWLEQAGAVLETFLASLRRKS